MPERDSIIDLATIDFDRVIADQEAIRRCIPQRYAMEQLSAVVHDDNEQGICVGYKDLTEEEFWVPGHMPGMPLMPGVLMCEAAAQLCSYQVRKHGTFNIDMLGFGGLDKVRFRGMVYPGERLILITERLALRPQVMIRSRFQCWVNQQLACEGELRGVALPADSVRRSQPSQSS